MIQVAYEALVVILRCPSVPDIINGKAPEVFLPQ
jgi:hypothetical protein